MEDKEFSLSCPISISDYPKVLLAHGGGGKLMQSLIDKMFRPSFSNSLLAQNHDSTVIDIKASRIAFTTDSYVVKPVFFPGGDIGTLAVNGTVNDLSMSGAKPCYISIGMIIEEGFPMENLWRVVQSINISAKEAGVEIVTGDTKVVDKGKGDGIFINSSGIGIIENDFNISPGNIKPGDAVIINGDLGRHGIAIMAEREGLAFESKIKSDCAPLNGIVKELIDSGIDIHCMRDLTRGGLSSAINELAESSKTEILIDDSVIPVHEDVQGACEILGFDPLYVANEGKFVVFVNPKHADKCLEIMKLHPLGQESAIIGKVTDGVKPIVKLKSKIGTVRILDMLSGEQLPRIC